MFNFHWNYFYQCNFFPMILFFFFFSFISFFVVFENWLCNCLSRCFTFSSSRQYFWTARRKCFWYVWLTVVVVTCVSILRHTWEKVCGKCSVDLKHFVREYYMPCALKKIMMAEASCSICKTIYKNVICKTCHPWYVVYISLFTVKSYHSVQKV